MFCFGLSHLLVFLKTLPLPPALPVVTHPAEDPAGAHALHDEDRISHERTKFLWSERLAFPFALLDQLVEFGLGQILI